MYRFSLSYSVRKAFPTVIYDKDKTAYNINADFRTALKIIRLLDDPDVHEQYKLSMVLKWFYVDGCPRGDIKETLAPIKTFLSYDIEPQRKRKRKQKQQFCFEFDAEEIYASFLQAYSIDLMRVDFLHWFEFQILLGTLPSETPFASKVQLRFADTKGLKGEALTKLKKAKAGVQIPAARKAVNVAEQKRLDEIWKKLESKGK